MPVETQGDKPALLWISFGGPEGPGEVTRCLENGMGGRDGRQVSGERIRGRGQAELDGRHGRRRGAVGDDVNMQELLDDIAVSREQNPHIAPGSQGAGKGR